MIKILREAGCVGLMLAAVGCGSGEQTDIQPEKKARPVEVRTLHKDLPPTAALVSASVASWKTEEIGFEVGGRVEWVTEPNTDIEGEVFDANGDPLIKGTPIARLESERFELQVEMAEADVARAVQSVNAARIELDKSLPSQMRAAEAEKKLAETEFERSKRLFQQDAGARSDVDRDEAKYESAVSKIEQLQATQKAKEAEIQSLTLQVEQARQALRDAKRSLNDCTLYSSFRGQIADVAVVPGSVVSAGQPVVTIQMMDPIKIELEVSAEDSRRLRKRQRIPLLVTRADGTQEQNDGFLYLIDPVADPLTRTFTLTLLMLNKKTSSETSEVDSAIPITDQAWRLDFSFLPGAEEGLNYVAEQAIRQDADGHFLWRITNFKQQESMPKDGLLKVSKLRIELGESKLPFLGNWVFQQINILDPSFDSNVELVAGQLTVNDGDPDDWEGDTILVDRTSQWMVRPGDLVKVDLSDGDATPGYYVPMDAIAHVGDKKFLFIVANSGGNETANRIEVAVVDQSGDATSSMMRIEPVAGPALDGVQYVTRGVHYLRDGESVRVITGGGATP